MLDLLPSAGSATRQAKDAMGKIDFDALLAKGAKSYDKEVGDWWVRQSEDAAHKRAYDHVARHVASAMRRRTVARGLVVDYACGNGRLLDRLAVRLPQARIVGLDGSMKLLGMTAARLRALGHDAAVVDGREAFGRAGPRIRLVHSLLPSFRLPVARADAVVFCFPNITMSAADQAHYDRHGYRHRGDQAVAKMLARFREMDPEDEVSTMNPDEHFDDLMSNRVVSRDLRRLLRAGGELFRVEYANGTREELSELSQWRFFFCEGALATPIKESRAQTFFRYRRCHYVRSKVILDVYHQTRDPGDKTGGYYIAD
jgi:SAM-dependent methyltransferase